MRWTVGDGDNGAPDLCHADVTAAGGSLNPPPNLQITNHTLTAHSVLLTEHALCECVCERDSQKFYLIPICVVSGTMILDRGHVNLHAIQN